jgi:hypothetical protein
MDRKAQLVVNGKRIPLNGYVQKAFLHVIKGLIETLRGIDSIETVELKLDYTIED